MEQASEDRAGKHGQDRTGEGGAAQDSTSRIGEGERQRRGPGQARETALKALKPAWMPQRDARTGQVRSGQDGCMDKRQRAGKHAAVACKDRQPMPLQVCSTLSRPSSFSTTAIPVSSCPTLPAHLTAA
jgi:hypothetical protein